MRRALIGTCVAAGLVSLAFFIGLQGYIDAPYPLPLWEERVEFMRPQFLIGLAVVPWIMPGLALSLANLP